MSNNWLAWIARMAAEIAEVWAVQDPASRGLAWVLAKGLRRLARMLGGK
ncbi:hypothetical protein JOF56_011632 [Kibdelosporangium banguiense]|uniref:Uncharacterized protein n=1 Tax=Kibdelosporangium banguiense TaxID=1365924 RepID=A0ABS4U3K4_9PSEU|nr:hypothetical protein [Kibdelosporangium banguiense]MBP2331247.1 hypothetical protein [Kibdelosporangium banguiense]